MKTLLACRSCPPAVSAFAADPLLVEAESFQQPGGWSLDTQFIHIMGSPYLLAHGLGAAGEGRDDDGEVSEHGQVSRVGADEGLGGAVEGAGRAGEISGRSSMASRSAKTFGTKGADWFWHDGGTVEIAKPETTLALHDLTGFDGRCDAIYFTKDDNADAAERRRAAGRVAARRRSACRRSRRMRASSISSSSAAATAAWARRSPAARMGCKVALIQDRPVLGGNGIERGARLGDGRHPPRAVSAPRRDRGGVCRITRRLRRARTRNSATPKRRRSCARRRTSRCSSTTTCSPWKCATRRTSPR